MAHKEKIVRHNFIWIDLEMTGLTPEKDVILEIATIVTDDNLEILAEGPELVIHQPKEKLEGLHEWVVKAHTKSGLFKRVEESTVSLKEAEEQTLSFLENYFKPGEGILCGNSVWNDKQFMRLHMPKLHNFMYYRMVDVSTIKELVKRWYPDSPYTDFKKRDTHRALTDIRESIEELRHYRTHFFTPEQFTHRPKKK